MLYTWIIHPVYSFASPELVYTKFGVSRLVGASNTFQVTPCNASAVYQFFKTYSTTTCGLGPRCEVDCLVMHFNIFLLNVPKVLF